MPKDLIVIIDGEQLDYESADVVTSLEYINDSDERAYLGLVGQIMTVTVNITTKKDVREIADKQVEELRALLAEVWAKTESYRGRMDFHMMLRGESKKGYEELRARVEKAFGNPCSLEQTALDGHGNRTNRSGGEE